MFVKNFLTVVRVLSVPYRHCIYLIARMERIRTMKRAYDWTLLLLNRAMLVRQLLIQAIVILELVLKMIMAAVRVKTQQMIANEEGNILPMCNIRYFLLITFLFYKCYFSYINAVYISHKYKNPFNNLKKFNLLFFS